MTKKQKAILKDTFKPWLENEGLLEQDRILYGFSITDYNANRIDPASMSAKDWQDIGKEISKLVIYKNSKYND